MKTSLIILSAALAVSGSMRFLPAQQTLTRPAGTELVTTSPTPHIMTAEELFRRNIGSPAQARKPFPPHKIIDNIYYVGTESLSSFLIVTPEGNILIDSTYEANVPGIKASTEKLGFQFSDIKILLGSHAHGDHQEADAMVAEMTGAKVMAMAEDIPDLKIMRTPSGKPRPNYLPLKDGDKVALGGTTLIAHLTPGHTHGCTTWTIQVREDGKTYDVAIIGSMGINSNTTRMWANGALTPLGEEYTRGFAAMHTIHADVVLGSHPAMHRMAEKYTKIEQASPVSPGRYLNPYIDPKGYEAELALEEGAFKLILETQQKASPAATTRAN